MSASYSQLPWLNIGPSDFLTALDRGTQAGLSKQELALKAASEAARLQLASQENQGGGRSPGFGAIRSDSINPFEQARTDALRSETKINEDNAAAKAAADAENRRLISIGVPPDEAAAQSGWSQYMRPSSGSGSLPWQTVPLGNGEVIQVGKKTGEVRQLTEPRPKVDTLKRDKLNALRSEMRGLQSGVGAILNKDRTTAVMAEIAALEQELGVTEGAASKAPETDPLGLFK